MNRIVTAWLAAPLFAAVLLALLTERSVIPVIIYAPFAYVFSLAGLPVYFLFRRLGWLHVWQVVPAAALLGGLVAVFTGVVRLPFNAPTNANALWFVLGGAFTGLAFWAFAFAGETKPRESV